MHHFRYILTTTAREQHTRRAVSEIKVYIFYSVISEWDPNDSNKHKNNNSSIHQILENVASGDVRVKINVHKQNPPWAEGHKHVEVFVQQHSVINV